MIWRSGRARPLPLFARVSMKDLRANGFLRNGLTKRSRQLRWIPIDQYFPIAFKRLLQNLPRPVAFHSINLSQTQSQLRWPIRLEGRWDRWWIHRSWPRCGDPIDPHLTRKFRETVWPMEIRTRRVIGAGQRSLRRMCVGRRLSRRGRRNFRGPDQQGRTPSDIRGSLLIVLHGLAHDDGLPMWHRARTLRQARLGQRESRGESRGAISCCACAMMVTHAGPSTSDRVALTAPHFDVKSA